MWLGLGICAVLVVLLLNGMVQQERIRLWKAYQGELAEKRRADLEEHRKAAADKIKDMLRSGRKHVEKDAGPAPAESPQPEVATQSRTDTEAERRPTAEPHPDEVPAEQPEPEPVSP